MVSLKKFDPILKGCNKPKGQQRFGPFRNCIQPITLRSASVKYTAETNNGTVIAKIPAIICSNGQPKSVHHAPANNVAKSTIRAGSLLLFSQKFLCAGRHGFRDAANGIGHIKIKDWINKFSLEHIAIDVAVSYRNLPFGRCYQ